MFINVEIYQSSLQESSLNVFYYLGFLRRKGQPHLLYKPVQAGSKGVQEVSFYDALYGVKTYLGTPSDFPSLCRGEGTDSVLRSFTPMYYGLASIADRGGKTRILCNIHIHSSMFVYSCICGPDTCCWKITVLPVILVGQYW